ncbi:dienelactone hydrolase family protein [Burkholderiaceae bacterium DAT-1]|nr:dienelactone hydrolase family protein [Burkholderiaceae bacterium DAT-1]
MSTEAVDTTRRNLITGALASGFALAVQPLADAATITTSTDHLVAGEVSIPVGDKHMPGYRAMPEGDGPFPVVLVVQEIFGVHEHIRDVCRRFARQGYLAVAPELYFRQGSVANLPSIDDIMKIVREVPDAQVMGDLDATVAWAKASSKGDTGKLAVTGFCWGGRITWLYTAHNPGIKAGVAWYGRLVGQPSANNPKHPADLAAQLHAPVLGLYGGDDKGIPQESVDTMRAAIKAANKPSEIIVYPNMPHGFHADYRETYREEAAKDGWKRLLAWFAANGVK